jgi:hypothetical protein
MAPPVFLITRLVVLEAEGLVLSIADDRDSRTLHSQRDQILFHRPRPMVPQDQIVFLSAPVIAMPFDLNFQIGVFIKELGIFL